MTKTFTILGEPKGKARPRFARMGNAVRTYTPKETENYEAFVKMSYLKDNGAEKLRGPISATIAGYFPIPKSAPKKKRLAMESGNVPYAQKIDADNLAKSILDALNGIAYDDDKQITELHVTKRYGINPCVVVRLEEINVEEKPSV